MLRVKQFIFNAFGESTFVVADEATGDAIVVDPGMADDDERRRFDDFITENKLKLTGVVNTHMHVDHCMGANYVRDRYGVPVRAHSADAFLGEAVAEQAARFGMQGKVSAVTIDAPLKAGDEILLGDERLEVIHVPGHSPGGIALYSPTGKFVIAGDSLFAGSIGRTDLPGGDYDTLRNSIREGLLGLPDDTLVLPGHGEPTTIGRERMNNMFLR
ncbi:MAG: MBL fold metallo-hydrolase [Bacteroidales bacterium]|nr:MBL fold metallo-hydrolase [Bacteroidales bacterium]